jgi:hypothetical protein
MTKGTATHTAYVLQRETRARARWLEVGDAFVSEDGLTGNHHVHLNRLPIGGFSGSIMLYPKGELPPDPHPEPERPTEPA